MFARLKVVKLWNSSKYRKKFFRSSSGISAWRPRPVHTFRTLSGAGACQFDVSSWAQAPDSSSVEGLRGGKGNG